MSNECKTARNTVITTVIVVLGLLILCSSCGSTHTSCAAYASVEVKSNK